MTTEARPVESAADLNDGARRAFEMPRVSIGLPVYNGERFVAAAISSILSQTFEDLELIIVDNASTDRTPEICRLFAENDTRVRYVRNVENVGAAANFNRAFELARGEYFKWAAADDLCAPTFIEHCVELLDDHSDAVLAFPDPVFIDEDETPLPYDTVQKAFIDRNGKRWYWRTDNIQNLASADAVERLEHILLRTYVCQEVFGLARTDALRRTSLIGNYYGSDKVLLAELSMLGGLGRTPNKLFLRRCHRGQSGYKSTREREVWIRGHQTGVVTFPQWRVFRGYLSALVSSDLAWFDKIRGGGVLIRYIARPHKIKKFFLPGPNNFFGIDFRKPSSLELT
jgi:glycosyltransferase involved in cell wall biosynthesis